MALTHDLAGKRDGARGTALLATFTLAIFTSAFLLFFIQPMFTKMVLPHLGGSPAVWSVAMVVFQALLLAGYGYAHLSITRLSTRHSVRLHIALLLVTALALPIAVSERLGTPPADGQALWLIGVFVLSVGLPFFAIAGNGPLLQAWFARSGHAHARDPYFLYGASNLGSFTALLLYPVLFEPLLPLKMQASGWTAGFALLLVMIAVAALPLRGGALETAPAHGAAISPAPGLARIFAWVALAFIPSGLLVAVTAHISTDVAAAPFLWVVPLALFLLTYVLLFREKPLVPMGFVSLAFPILAACLVVFSFFSMPAFGIVLAVHLGFFFVATLVCHHRLYRLRPAADRLTEFYLWMSLGGVLGGLFCGLLAPLIFDRVLEYPILAILALVALPQAWSAEQKPMRQVAGLVLLAGLGFFLLLRAYLTTGDAELPPVMLHGLLFFTIAAMMMFRWPLVVMAMLAVSFASVEMAHRLRGDSVSMRSFFGVHKLARQEQNQFRILSHGTTLHGAMRIANADGTPVPARPMPLLYYHPAGPIAASLRAVPQREGGRRVAMVGLGSGAHACNGTDTDRWSFFEIDPLVVRIAQNRDLFRFLSECAPAARMVLGDARLMLAREPQAAFDYLLIDAFSSDAIPLHLLTREAVALYLEKLAPQGILAIHISNRHLELESVVAAIARDLGIPARIQHFAGGSASGGLEDATRSSVVTLARAATALAPLEAMGGWQPASDRGIAAWTDDFSNILTALWRNYAN